MEVRFFNESNSDERNTCLIPTNEISDIEIVGVNWSHPQGSFRVNGETTVTHLIATFNNRPFIYKVTSYRAINNGVIEYYYDIDYMKTYFYINQWTKLQNARINRSCNPLHWNRYLPDEKWEVKEPKSINQVGYEVSKYLFMLVLNNVSGVQNADDGGKDIYFLTDSGLDKLQKFLLEDKKSSVCMSQIYGVFVLPVPTASSSIELAPIVWGFNTEYHTIVFKDTVIYDGDTPHTFEHVVQGLGPTECQRVIGYNRNYKAQWSSSITVSTNDFRDIAPVKTRILHVPYIGDINVPENIYEWSDISDPHISPHEFDIGATYWLNPYEGTISACLNKDVGIITVDLPETKTPYRSLPRVALSSSDIAVVSDIAYTNMNLAKTNNEVNSGFAKLNAISGGIIGGASLGVNMWSTASSIENTANNMRNAGYLANEDYNIMRQGYYQNALGANQIGNAVGNYFEAIARESLNDAQISTSYRNQILSATSKGYTMTSSEGYESFQDNTFRLYTLYAQPVNDFDKFMSAYGYLSLLIVSETTTDDGYKMWLSTNDCVVNNDLEYALYDIQRRYICGNFATGLWLDGQGVEHNTHRPTALDISWTGQTNFTLKYGSGSSSIDVFSNSTDVGTKPISNTITGTGEYSSMSGTMSCANNSMLFNVNNTTLVTTEAYATVNKTGKYSMSATILVNERTTPLGGLTFFIDDDTKFIDTPNVIVENVGDKVRYTLTRITTALTGNHKFTVRFNNEDRITSPVIQANVDIVYYGE